MTPSKLENKLYPLVSAADVGNPNVSEDDLG